MRYSAQKGTRDILPQEIYNWQKAEKTFADVCHSFGYEEIRIPTFEQTDLFQRGVGDTTDVVTKEMYTFEDKGGRSITLRPEGTAGVVRSFIENGMTSLPSPVRMFYNITAFRYEKMQKGRMREFHQFGLESFGSAGPDIDAEIISVVDVFFKKMGLKNIALHINSIGCPHCRPQYRAALVEYFTAHEEELCDTCRERLKTNPLRILDCKSPICSKIAQDCPRTVDYLCDDCAEHLKTLEETLTAMGISYRIDPKIVRGLDYYVRTVFEFISGDIGAQSTVCGGGRYDGLVEELDGPPLCGIGFGLGLTRLVLAMRAGVEKGTLSLPEKKTPALYIAPMGKRASTFAMALVYRLRTAGVIADCDIVGRSLKAQMKYADKLGARYALVLGDNELDAGKASLKDLRGGESEEVLLDAQTLVERLK